MYTYVYIYLYVNIKKKKKKKKIYECRLECGLVVMNR